MPERLQKVLASAGLGSRRQCEELILAGRVEVDRQVVTQLGTRVDPARQEVRVDGTRLPRLRHVHYIVNKPPGVVSTNRDPAGRPRVIDMVPEGRARVYAVGRLDMSSEGLILVTNDGELANRLTHPKFGVEKTYHVLVAGTPTAAELGRLKKGVHLAEGTARALDVWIKSRRKQSTLLEMVLDEGRNREIRRMLARLGHRVLKLRRVAIAGLRFADVPMGASRRLTAEEVRQLERAARQSGQRADDDRPDEARHTTARGQHTATRRGKPKPTSNSSTSSPSPKPAPRKAAPQRNPQSPRRKPRKHR